MITSWLGFVYLLLFKVLVWMTSADTIQKYSLTRVASGSQNDAEALEPEAPRQTPEPEPEPDAAAPNFAQRRESGGLPPL